MNQHLDSIVTDLSEFPFRLRKPAVFPRLFDPDRYNEPPNDPRTDVEYRVELDIYNGPLDLLLYLIKRDELDIYDIPISKITDSYLAYLNMAREMQDREGLDINVAGEFLVMAATLMEIKSATLLPKAKPTEQEAANSAAQDVTDPRFELVQQILEYKKLKDSATLLEHRQHEHESRFPRFPASREI